MAGGAGQLGDRVAVPLEAQPFQAVADGVYRRLAGACAVRILDPQEERAAVVAREQPVEERGAGTADMQEPGGGGGETGDDGHGR